MMKDLKKLEKNTKYPVYFLDENSSLQNEHIHYLKELISQDPSIKKIRLLLNPSFHDAKQESIFIANEGTHFAEKRFPFLPWMECELLEGQVSLLQEYPQGQDTTFLDSSSPLIRFDPAVFHSYKISSPIAVFKTKTIGPYLEKLVQKKIS